MAEHTQNFNLPYPLASYAPAGADQIQLLADAVDAALTNIAPGSIPGTPPPSNPPPTGPDMELLTKRVTALESQMNWHILYHQEFPVSTFKLSIQWKVGRNLKKGDRYYIKIREMRRPAGFGGVAGALLKFRPDVVMGRYGGAGHTQYVRMQPYDADVTASGYAKFRVLITIDHDFTQTSGRYYKAIFLVTNSKARGGTAQTPTLPGELSIRDYGITMPHAADEPGAVTVEVAGDFKPDTTGNIVVNIP